MQFSPLKNIVLAGISAAVFSTVLLPQNAEARPSTRSYTCEGVNDYIDDRGAVVMNTKNRSVYRRLVADRSYCHLNESLKNYFTPTRDGLCRVNICVDIYYRKGFGRD